MTITPILRLTGKKVPEDKHNFSLFHKYSIIVMYDARVLNGSTYDSTWNYLKSYTGWTVACAAGLFGLFMLADELL